MAKSATIQSNKGYTFDHTTPGTHCYSTLVDVANSEGELKPRKQSFYIPKNVFEATLPEGADPESLAFNVQLEVTSLELLDESDDSADEE